MPRNPSESWIDRELAALEEGLKQLEASIAPRHRQQARVTSVARKPAGPRGRPRGTAGKSAQVERREEPGHDASASLPAAAAPAETPPAPPTPPPPPPTRPSGTDLSDPKNFGLAPPMVAIDRQEAEAAEPYRDRLVQHLRFATQVLHTSGVPAAVWREWRAFEKDVQARLRSLSMRPPEIEPGAA